jgi:branched-chain amino acid transport system ATP-binding protein
MTLLSVEALAVRYGAVPALRGVSIDVGAQEAVALLGANGAGKSTLMKAVIGLLRPAAGRILFDGAPVDRLRADRRARLGIGYCPEGRRTFPGLSVRENLAVACWGNARVRARRTDEIFAMFPALAARQATLAWQLSGGQQQMLALGRSLMDAPRLLLLDEPSLGLSPLLTDEVLGRIPAIVAGGTAVLLAEQNAAKALQVCTRAVVLKLGQVAAEGPAAALAASDEVRAAFLGG